MWNSNPQITSSLKVVKILSNWTNPADSLYGCVLLNAPESVTATGLTEGTTTFSDFIKNNLVGAADATNSDNGFLMSSAPVSTKVGGTTDPSAASIRTLTNLKVYSTEEAAQNATPDAAYVERLASKVTVAKSGTTGNFTDNNKGQVAELSDYKYEIDMWQVDNTEPNEYLVRQFNTDWLSYQAASVANWYRFVYSQRIEDGAARTDWAMDPSYDTRVGSLITLGPKAVMTGSTKFGDEAPAYFTENTFKETAQKENEATRVVFRAKLVKAADGLEIGDFYTIGDETGIYTKDQYQSAVNTLFQNYIYNFLMQHLVAGQSIPGGEQAVPVVNVTFAANTDDTGLLEVTGAQIATGSTSLFDFTGNEFAEGVADYITSFNKNYPVYKYDGGEMYYTYYFRHFGDEETPWTDGNDPADEKGKADGAANYLGRWGNVRNNWYQINVTGVRNLGSPVIPTPGDSDLDKKEQYISVKINILPWRLRPSDVVLQ
ncbi:MAG: fimbria major subunit [Paraprevotella sp.]|nr:fimbria major subunit [Paraprevotella sp.]